MAVIALPDGREIEFPDDMPETQIRTALLKLSQGEKEQAKSSVVEQAGTGLEGVMNGIPIVGPMLDAASNRVAAFGSSMLRGSRYADELKAIEGQTADRAERYPVTSTAGNVAGAVAGTIPLAIAAPTAMGVRGASLGARALAGATSGATIGGADGAVRSGGDLDQVAVGGGFGALAGGAAPYVGRAVGAAAQAVGAPIMARLRPDNATRTALVRAMQRSGQTPEQITAALRDATADGQSVFTVADAIGHPGQRMMSAIARTPGEGREAVVAALDARQAGQGRRVANALSEGFDAPDTAAQRTATLKASRGADADANYAAARGSAYGVDVTDAIGAIDDVLKPGLSRFASITDNLAPDSVEAALARVRPRLTDGTSNLAEFDAVLRVKQDVDDAIGKAVRAGENNKARLLGQVRDSLDNSLANSSGPYAAARDAFRQGSREIEAVDAGRSAATRGRSEDTTRAFAAMSPGEQQAFRPGYVDPLIEQTQGGAIGVNKARPLLNDATAQEFPAFAAPGRADQLGRRLQREQTMFETRHAAMGGSKTADNVGDQAELGMLDPTVVGNLISGNWTGALKSGGLQALRQMQGMPAPVRQRLATVLLQTDASKAGRELAQAIARGEALTERQLVAAQAILRGGSLQAN